MFFSFMSKEYRTRFPVQNGSVAITILTVNSTEFQFRVANESDAEALVPLINRAFEVELQFFTTDRIDLDETLNHLKKGIFLLAENEGRFAGCNYVELRDDSGYFGLLSVDPDFQGKGLGRILVDQAEVFCRDAGQNLMRIRVLNHRTELPPFYEKLGYHVAQIEEVEQEPAARMPYHFIVMEKSLA
jgi:GNAT superfamily N-acetyltransferase